MNFNSKDKQRIKLILFIVTCSIIIFTFLQNFESILVFFHLIVGILSPFLLALGLAFLVNMPMSMIENKLLSHLPLPAKLRRALALVLSYIIVIAAIVFLLFTVIPQLIVSVQTLIANIPSFLRNLESFLRNSEWAEPFVDQFTEQIADINNSTLMEYVQNWLAPQGADYINRILDTLMGTISNVFTSTISFFLSFIFSIYMLNSKETLVRQAKELLYSLSSEKVADKAMYVGYTAYDNFFNFFTGQFMEAIILGIMSFIGMTILQLPYALVISTLIGFGALIPMIGAILAGMVGFFILLTVSPIQALGFGVFIVILQQFDGNLVYPKVVGRQVGLPSLWVLFAVTIGGSLYGIFGMLIFVPIASTIYDLLSDYKTKKLSEAKINVELK